MVISPGVPDSINPALDATGDGMLHAAWYQFDGRRYQVRLARNDGQWSLPRSLTAGPVDHAGVALAADGLEVHIVWEERATPQRVMHRRLDGDARPVRVSGGESSGDPVIGAAAGVVVAAWREGQRVVLRPLRPLRPPVVLGPGHHPMVAVRQGVAYVASTHGTDASAEVRFARIPVR